MSSRARNHVVKSQVNEVVHVSYHGSAIGTITEATTKQDQTMPGVDEDHAIKVKKNVRDQHKFLSTTTPPTKSYVRLIDACIICLASSQTGCLILIPFLIKQPDENS